MRSLLLTAVLVGSLYVSCSNDDEPASPPVSPAAGAAGVAPGSSNYDGGGGRNATQGGTEAWSGGASPGGAPVSGGGGAAEVGGGTAGAVAGGDQGGGAGAGAGGRAEGGGGAAGAGGREEVPEVPINGCVEFVDARASAELRVVAWDYALGGDPGRCLLVQVGHGVTWEGPFSTHPIQPAGGTKPSPILGDTPAGATSYQVTFGSLGTYGYECGLHATMRGAIRVLE